MIKNAAVEWSFKSLKHKNAKDLFVIAKAKGRLFCLRQSVQFYFLRRFFHYTFAGHFSVQLSFSHYSSPGHYPDRAATAIVKERSVFLN